MKVLTLVRILKKKISYIFKEDEFKGNCNPNHVVVNLKKGKLSSPKDSGYKYVAKQSTRDNMYYHISPVNSVCQRLTNK